MARLDQVITTMVDIFLEYANDGEGKKPKLNKEELKKVLEQEIQSPELKVSNAQICRWKKNTQYSASHSVPVKLYVFFRKRSTLTKSRRSWRCWIKTTMVRSTSRSFVGVLATWPNATTVRRQARAARKARAKTKNVNRRTNYNHLNYF